jgi:hypothetical protein
VEGLEEPQHLQAKPQHHQARATITGDTLYDHYSKQKNNF